MSKKPNVIVCTCDQLRAFETGCYGNEVIRTPNVDRLAREGVRFETAVTNFPVCMAARSILLSGEYNRTCTGGVSNVSYGKPGESNMPEYPYPGRPHLKDKTLPEILRGEGYHTQVIGKWHIHSWPHDVGFDNYLIPRVHHCHTGQSFTEDGGPEFTAPGYSVDYEARRVEQYLDSRKDEDSPFFLYYNISVPHCPLYDAPEGFRGMYSPGEVPLRENVDTEKEIKRQDHWFKVYRHDFRYYNFHLPYTQKLPEGYSLRHVIAEYYGMTTWMDTVFGRMLDALDRAGLADDTIVVFVSDHGDNLGSHGLVQKGRPNEESIRIPMIVRGSGINEGEIVKSHVGSLVDVAPTLLSFLDVEAPEHFAGRDLSALCRGEKADVPDHAIIETKKSNGIRSPKYTYVVPFKKGTRELADEPSQLFDNRNDPYQFTNMAEQGELPAEAEKIDLLLRQWDEATPWMEN